MVQASRYKLLNNRSKSLNSVLVDDVRLSMSFDPFDYLRLLRSHYLIIFISIFTCSLAGLIAALLKTPTYEATMLLQVGPSFSRKIGSFGEERIGQDNNISAITESEIVKSRAVIGAAANELGLTINSRPKYFPLIGRFLAATSSASRSSTLPLLQEFCWGAEHIQVKAFDVPKPLLFKKFEISLQAGRYYLLHNYGTEEFFTGRVGVVEKFPSKLGTITLLVASVFGQTGQTFILERRSDISVVEDIQRSLSVSESAKASNMIRVAYKGTDPISTSTFLRSLATQYREISAGNRAGNLVSSMAVATLELPALKHHMEIADRKYNDARRKYEVANVGDIGNVKVNRVANLREKQSDFIRKQVELGSVFGPSHPVFIAINEQLKTLNAELASAEREVASIPAIEEELQNLAREAKINADLYTALLRSSREMSLATEKYSDEVRIIDPPVEPTERSDSPVRIFFGCAVLGAIIGVSSALIIDVLQRRARQQI